MRRTQDASPSVRTRSSARSSEGPAGSHRRRDVGNGTTPAGALRGNRPGRRVETLRLRCRGSQALCAAGGNRPHSTTASSSNFAAIVGFLLVRCLIVTSPAGSTLRSRRASQPTASKRTPLPRRGPGLLRFPCPVPPGRAVADGLPGGVVPDLAEQFRMVCLIDAEVLPDPDARSRALPNHPLDRRGYEALAIDTLSPSERR